MKTFHTIDAVIDALLMNKHSSIKLQIITTMQSMMHTTQNYNTPMFLTTGELWIVLRMHIKS